MLLFSLIKKFVIRNTHHFLSIKAAEYLPYNWKRVFLAYFDALLSGAKAPDDKFHDWKNHVFHPPEWGGAPSASKEAYEKFVEYLKNNKWKDAIFWAGVLSHYISDVLHPLHTGQTPEEPKVHKFHEFGTSRKIHEYDLKIKVGSIDTIEDIERYVRELGTFSHKYYFHVIHNYDLSKAEKFKWELGITEELDKINLLLLSRAVKAILSVWMKGIKEANVSPPKVSLSLRTLITLLKIPVYRIRKWLEHHYYKSVTKRMLEELKKTGKIYKSLPPDDKGLVDYFMQLEKEGKLDMSKAREAYEKSIKREAIKSMKKLGEIPKTPPEQPEEKRTKEVRPPLKPVTMIKWKVLRPEDDVELAPEIGPKTAKRLRSIGIKTIRDLISTPIEEIRARFSGRKPPRREVIRWKYETKLMMEIPGLRVKDAVYLYEIGIRSRSDLLKTTPEEIMRKLEEFLVTPRGKSLSERLTPPTAERIKRIFEWAEKAKDEIPEVNIVI